MPDAKNKSSFKKFIALYKNDWKVRLAIRLILIGLLYGYISAINNQNPYYPVKGRNIVSDEYRAAAWHWQPSFCWFPSYILCKIPPNGIGIAHTKSGYLFRSLMNRYLYISMSTFLGGVFGLIIAIVIVKLKYKTILS